MNLPSPSLLTLATPAPAFRTLTTTPETGAPVGSVSLPQTHRTGLIRSCLGQVTSALNWRAGRRVPAMIAARKIRFRSISHRRSNAMILRARGSVSLQHRTANSQRAAWAYFCAIVPAPPQASRLRVVFQTLSPHHPALATFGLCRSITASTLSADAFDISSVMF